MPFSYFVVAGTVALWALSGSSVRAQEALKTPAPASVTIENASARLVLSAGGGIRSLALRDGRELLEHADARLMMVQIGETWHGSSSLIVDRAGAEYRFRVGFENTEITAGAVLKPHPSHFELQAVCLEGKGREDVTRWVFANVPVGIRANIGEWLNVAWDDQAAVALLALEERTDAAGSPLLRASTIGKLGLDGGKAALIACPRSRVLEVIHQVEKEHGLPAATLGGQWAKTSAEVRRSWMITGLTAAPEPAAFQAQRVFQTARALGVEHVVIALGWWNRSFGSYGLNSQHFPAGVASLKAVADQAHACGLKLGIHVMTRSISKDDALVTPRPDPRLHTEGTVTLAAAVAAAAQELPTIESPASFGTDSGYWAYRGTDVLIDQEIVRYQAISAGSVRTVAVRPWGLRHAGIPARRRSQGPTPHRARRLVRGQRGAGRGHRPVARPAHR